MASREGSAAAGGAADRFAFACVRVVAGACGLRRGLRAAALAVSSGVTTAASTSAAGGTDVAAGGEARRAREALVWRRGRGAAASGETPVSFSDLVFLFISFLRQIV